MPSDADLEDGMEGKKAASPWRIFTLARPEWPWLVLGLVFLVFSLIPYLFLPIAIGRILDALVKDNSNEEKEDELTLIVLVLLMILLVGSLFALVRSFIFNTAGERVVARLRVSLFKSIINQEIGLFDKRKTGELLSRLGTDTTSLQDVATSSVSMFFRGTIQLLFNAAIMFVSSWKLTLVVFGVVPTIIISIVLYGRVVRRLATKYSDALGRATDTAQESIANVRTMRSFAGEFVEVAKYTRSIGDPDARAGDDLGFYGPAGPSGGWCWLPPRAPPHRLPTTYRLGVQKQALTATFIAFTSFMGLGAFILVVWFGGKLVIEGDLTVGDLVAFMLYTTQIGASIGMMSGLVGSIFVAQGASKRTFQLIDREPKVPASGGLDPDGPHWEKAAGEKAPARPPAAGAAAAAAVVVKAPRKALKQGEGGPDEDASGGRGGGAGVELVGKAAVPAAAAFKGAIAFDNVHFAYPSRPDVPVLKGLTLAIPVNATVAFVGSSGAGKSTVLALLERFYDATSGTITVDGHDLRTLDPRYLRRHVALVAQEPVLFGMTVAQNIAYGYAAARGDPDATPTREDVQAAASAAFAHDFIAGFPEGYDTLVGERGVRLSGGQKQRIAIARALLVDPRVLLLDEATSALDAESEHLVQKAINALMKSRTTLVVAHRLSTVRNADQIVVIADHAVSAVGTHDELLSSSAIYADLVKRQLSAGGTSGARPDAVEAGSTAAASL